MTRSIRTSWALSLAATWALLLAPDFCRAGLLQWCCGPADDHGCCGATDGEHRAPAPADEDCGACADVCAVGGVPITQHPIAPQPMLLSALIAPAAPNLLSSSVLPRSTPADESSHWHSADLPRLI